jgi:hypothetical protein
MEDNKPLTVTEFACIKNVPEEAILDAIRDGRIIPMELNNSDISLATIHPAYIDSFKIELIGVYEYRTRKDVTYKSVYNKIDNGQIKYYLDPTTNSMKIDWVQYADVQFRKFAMKHRGKNKTIVN